MKGRGRRTAAVGQGGAAGARPGAPGGPSRSSASPRSLAVQCARLREPGADGRGRAWRSGSGCEADGLRDFGERGCALSILFLRSHLFKKFLYLELKFFPQKNTFSKDLMQSMTNPSVFVSTRNRQISSGRTE